MNSKNITTSGNKSKTDTKQEVIENPLLESKDLKRTLKVAAKLAALNDSLLLLGEPGVGKTQIARYIHALSPRSSKNLIEINCGSLPSSATDSVLFGHVKGAFHTATKNVAGIFERCDGGTILLNDIDYLSLEQQAKLLGVLDVKKIQKPGEYGIDQDVDFRLIATTNKNIKQLLVNEELLPDFYIRLNQWRLTVPPLRKRKSCIKILSQHLLNKFKSELNADVVNKNDEWCFSEEILDLFYEHPWPGNIRELNTAIKNVAYLVEGYRSPISLERAKDILFDEQDGIFSSYCKPQSNDSEFERDAKFQKALELSNGNISQAAKFTGLSRTTAHKIIKKNGWEVRAKIESM